MAAVKVGLILSRHHNEAIIIYDRQTQANIRVLIADIRGDKVRVGIEADRTRYGVHREEVFDKIVAEGKMP